MLRITDVVKHLLLINILMYFGTYAIMGEPGRNLWSQLIGQGGALEDWGRLQLALFFPTSEYFRVYQMITHMFMHADGSHLFLNMFALFMFGPLIEARMGSKRFLQYYILTGMGAMALHLFVSYLRMENMAPHEAAMAMNVPMLGASGAIFGLLAAFAMFFPNQTIYLIFPPIPMKAWVFVTVFAAIELFSGLGNFGSGVAHFAHLGGALFGFLVILYWRRQRLV